MSTFPHKQAKIVLPAHEKRSSLWGITVLAKGVVAFVSDYDDPFGLQGRGGFAFLAHGQTAAFGAVGGE